MGQEIVRYSAHLLRGIPLDRRHAPYLLHIRRKGELFMRFDTRTSEQTDLRESEAITFRYSVWRGTCEACAESARNGVTEQVPVLSWPLVIESPLARFLVYASVRRARASLAGGPGSPPPPRPFPARSYASISAALPPA